MSSFLGAKLHKGILRSSSLKTRSWLPWPEPLYLPLPSVCYGPRPGAHAFRAWFSRLLEDAGFGPSDYTPYALRRGGATWWFQHTLSIDSVVARGRWACPRTAKSYVDEGTMQLANVTWTRAQRRRVREGQRFCSQVRLRQKRSRSGTV